ncbi:MAG: M28 family peptidase [Candidatus Latescibacterota bacterium]|nr:MAG: M28 family peptidase [Candidatus Latescibacterota bacterium]
MSSLHRILVPLLLLGPAATAAQDGLDAALQSVRAEAIRAHMAFLADDLLEGRETGTRGYQLAANYVATQLDLLGLKAAGDDGGFLQWMPLRRAQQIETECRFTLVGETEAQELVYAQHYLMTADALRETSDVAAPLVYVGYGVSAPDLGYDDYANVDATGKVVVLLRGAPPTFPHNQRAYHATSRVKQRLAAERGAVGMLQFLTPEDAAKRPWEKSVVNSKIASMRALDGDGNPTAVQPELRIHAFLSRQGAEALFAGASSSLQEVFAAAASGETHSLDLPYSGQLKRASRHQRVRSCNVAGLLQGSDPLLRDEVVVYTAHLDHLGVGATVEGDSIYNGAFDNASGTAVLLEIARAFASMPQAPRRSLLFLAVTGEEKGLLGSEYFMEFPTVPRENIVANINLDMFLMLHPMRDLIAFGEEHSTLTRAVARAADRLGFEVTPDPMPEEVIFVRSDQYSFVRRGIPALFLVAGGKGHEPGKVHFSTWIRDIYHTQKDDLGQDVDYGAGVTFTQANVLIGYEIANEEGRPRWNDGDFFGDLFGRTNAADASR